MSKERKCQEWIQKDKEKNGNYLSGNCFLSKE